MMRIAALVGILTPALAVADEIQVGGPTGLPTIQAAVDVAHSGDVIRIADGEYTESVVIDRVDLTRLTLRAAPGAHVTVVGSNDNAHTINAVDCDLDVVDLQVVASNPSSEAPKAIRLQTLSETPRMLRLCQVRLLQAEINDGSAVSCGAAENAPVGVTFSDTHIDGFDLDVDGQCFGYTDGWDWIDTVCQNLLEGTY